MSRATSRAAAGEFTDIICHTGPLWRWTSASTAAAWFFVTIDGEAGEALSAIALMRRLESGRRGGFGSLKVRARIGGSEFATSVFPSRDLGWILPVKAAVRKAEGLGEGSEVTVTLDV